MIVVLRAPSLADRVAAAGGAATEEQERHWTARPLSAQQDVLLKLATKGVFVKPELRFTRVAQRLLGRARPERGRPSSSACPQVEGVYPRPRRVPRLGVGRRRPRGRSRGQRDSRCARRSSGSDGRGVTSRCSTRASTRVAVPHTARAARHRRRRRAPSTRGRRRRRTAPPRSSARDRDGRASSSARARPGLAGVAPGATLLPIRVAGWQRDDAGRVGLFARTDQVLAGLERAVDPERRRRRPRCRAHRARRRSRSRSRAFADGPLAMRRSRARSILEHARRRAGRERRRRRAGLREHRPARAGRRRR